MADKEKRTKELIERFLGRRRYIIKAAASDVELVRRMVRDKVSLLLVDVFLPGIKIYELIPIIQEIRTEVPIIVMVDENTPYLERKVRETGIFYYLLKPVEKREMREVVKDGLAARGK